MDRKLIFSGNSQVLVSGVKNKLDEAGIAYFEINKSDSSYPGILGEIEIFVHEADEVKAKTLIKDLL
ncbi:DUF2007 domain-containing protein [Oceanihabitans sediminis]|uniref:DUF2007 domain-containing protein n=1 Tax=Oceanihabitans sediminis TaxID=1812012 RepID=A0A368P7R2_9FLAO|nr:DUF2007 domain-containing protein [Oceanihabitans sediminis]MDX1278368.1 DUF2007 domain-containing protein [Oceanihabitans sediminis]MDX1772588.1 DUF2007 domain-containing protein [Oceanihabitans sediminis]RBP34255.1 putative signal transducing protein [Oceanihabitans sediminis]RCU57945.1 DUF2007 domain-containing protein [Oceanihabitans sediminis]